MDWIFGHLVILHTTLVRSAQHHAVAVTEALARGLLGVDMQGHAKPV